jgi:VIT1/CCC1 family predicted Fe2+/Mn2+ transporter
LGNEAPGRARECDFAYTKQAVPMTTASMGLFLLGGLIILANFILSTTSLVAQIALSIVGLGMIGMILGICLFNSRDWHVRQQLTDISSARTCRLLLDAGASCVSNS